MQNQGCQMGNVILLCQRLKMIVFRWKLLYAARKQMGRSIPEFRSSVEITKQFSVQKLSFSRHKALILKHEIGRTLWSRSSSQGWLAEKKSREKRCVTTDVIHPSCIIDRTSYRRQNYRTNMIIIVHLATLCSIITYKGQPLHSWLFNTKPELCRKHDEHWSLAGQGCFHTTCHNSRLYPL